VKQKSNQRIGAHLLRSAFYIILVVTVSSIPFAVGQRAKQARPRIAQSSPSTFPTGCGLDWRIAASPNSSASTNILFGVGGVYYASNVWAVGVYYDENFTAHTLAEYWDGTAWIVQSTPNPGSTANQLNAVAVGSGVWAVGYFTDENFIAHTLIEYWNGIWQVVPSPDHGDNGSYLQSVTVEGFNSVWAVGYYIDENLVNQTLVEHWDGQSWTIIPSPNRGTDGSQLNGIIAVSFGPELWAVGYSGQGNGVQTLIERWNGSVWTIVDSPNPGTSGNYLQAITEIPASGDLWAAGYYYDSGHPRTLIERWDGVNWHVVPSPNVGTVGNSLFGVSGFSANDVWAVGAYNLNNQTGTLQTLAEQWDGNAWNIVPSPNQGGADNILYAATRAQLADWAVGTYSDGINGRTLTLHYSDPCVTPTPTPHECSPSPCFTPTPTPPATATPRVTPTPRLRPTAAARP
jgi:hypothetical protein